jgi:hypothetical protein
MGQIEFAVTRMAPLADEDAWAAAVLHLHAAGR